MVGAAKTCADVALKQFPDLSERVDLTNDKFDLKITKISKEMASIQKEMTKLSGGDVDDSKYVVLQAKCEQ